MSSRLSPAVSVPDPRPGRAALGVGACWLCLLLLYRADVAAMVSLWLDSATFTYGFLVAPGAAYLAWQRREALRRAAPRPCWPLATGLLAASMIWMLGELSSLQAARQIAFVAMLGGSLWLIAGTAVARVLAWPLLFLFFLVPEGEFLIPRLMDWTADFTAAAARASGIPVFREGMQLMIPAGSFRIIEACSGVRFLLTSVALGFFMAGAVFRDWRRRAILLAVSAILPVLANGLRAYGIVLLGHLSDMRLVADHVLIGQVFFSAICFLVCWLAIRYSDLDALTVMPVSASRIDLDRRSRSGSTAAAAVLAIAVGWLGPVLAPGMQNRLAERPAGPLPGLPAAIPGSALASPPAGAWRPEFTGATSEIARRYADVDVYAFIYAQESEGAELVNARNTLFDREQFRRIRAQRNLRHSSGLRFNQLEIRGVGGARLLRYWYLLDDEVLPRPEAAKLRALSQLFETYRPAGSLIALGVRFDGDIASAERRLDRFLDAFCAADIPAGSLHPCGS